MNETTKKIMSNSNKIRKVASIFYVTSIIVGIILLLCTVFTFFIGSYAAEPELTKSVPTLLTATMESILFTVICHTVKSIFTKVSTTGIPFQKSICLDIQHIGILILVTNTILPIISLLITLFISGGVLDDSYSIPFSFGNILLGVIVLFLSKVFEYGVDLQDESDHTL